MMVPHTLLPKRGLPVPHQVQSSRFFSGTKSLHRMDDDDYQLTDVVTQEVARLPKASGFCKSGMDDLDEVSLIGSQENTDDRTELYIDSLLTSRAFAEVESGHLHLSCIDCCVVAHGDS